MTKLHNLKSIKHDKFSNKKTDLNNRVYSRTEQGMKRCPGECPLLAYNVPYPLKMV